MTTEATHPSQPASPGSCIPQEMPEFWPTPAGTPRVRPVWIPWLIAVILAPLFWLFPKRLGPHFAAAGWRAAVAALLSWGLYGAATIAMTAVVGPQYGLMTWLVGRTPEQMGTSLMPVATLSEILRAPLAISVGAAALGNGLSMASGGLMVVALLITVLAIGLAVVVVSLLLMPYVAAGERTRTLLGRTVRLVMWATTSLVVLGWMLQAVGLLHSSQAWVEVFAVLVYIIWAIGLVIRGGSRYSGPAEGRAWQQRTPMCEGCGYTLTALPLTASCPECGLRVAESLPDRREPLRFAAPASHWLRCKTYLPTLWAVLADKSFFRRLRMHDAHPAARCFATWTYAVVYMVMWLTGYATAWLWEGAMWQGHVTWRIRQEPGVAWSVLGETANGFGWCVPGILLLGGLLALIACRFGSQDVQRRSVAVFYCSAWLLPIWISLILTFNVVIWLGSRAYFTWAIRVPGLGRLDLYDVLVVLPLVIPLVVACWSIARLMHAVRQTHHANA